MSTSQQRLGGAMRLAVLFRDAANLNLQLSELKRLRDEVNQAQRSDRKSRSTNHRKRTTRRATIPDGTRRGRPLPPAHYSEAWPNRRRTIRGEFIADQSRPAEHHPRPAEHALANAPSSANSHSPRYGAGGRTADRTRTQRPDDRRRKPRGYVRFAGGYG